jgi:hypothetical protein
MTTRRHLSEVRDRRPVTKWLIAVAVLLAAVFGGGAVAPGTAAANSYTVVGGSSGQGWSREPSYASRSFVDCFNNSGNIDVHFNPGDQGVYWSRVWLKDVRTNQTWDYGWAWHSPGQTTFRGDRWWTNLRSGSYEVYAQVAYLWNGQLRTSDQGWFSSYRNRPPAVWLTQFSKWSSVCEIRR